MKKYFLLTAFGKDRPGIVAGVSQVLFDLGGNMQDASMTRLGGEFAMMLVTSLPVAVSVAKLDKPFRALEKKMGLKIEAKEVPPAVAHRSGQEPSRYLISLYGTDRPGIVHKVAAALAKRKVSITDLQTKVTGKGRKPVYVMLLELHIPSNVNLDDVRTDLDQLRHDLQVEISFQDIETIPL